MHFAADLHSAFMDSLVRRRTMKSIAGRLQDLADIERLRADQGEGDADNASET